jgi:DNA-binding transcriptional LysR family regulator
MSALIEPDLLHTFVAIAETGSFTDAARRVHRTQSAVSMQIKRLEDLLGKPVFVREGRSVRLTSDGELLLGHARRILRAHQEAMALFAPSPLKGTVRFGTPDEYAVTVLPSILGRFAETHPLADTEVICDTTGNLLRRLDERSVDLALITHGHGADDGIVLWREPLAWVTSAHHDTQERDPLPLALFHQGCRFRQWGIEALAAAGRAYRIAYTSVSLAAIEAAVRSGLAVSVLTHSTSSREGLRILSERDGFPPLPHYQVALKRADGPSSPIIEAFGQHILDAFRIPRTNAA